MRTLREMIGGDKTIAAPLVMNPIMAKLAERAGFEALYLGGGSMGYLKTILEANLNLTEMIQAGTDIRAACSLPLILDAAAGWGDPMHIRHTIAMEGLLSSAGGWDAHAGPERRRGQRD
jgi:2-methylisocitrate lyase-like PEP mutase family enzyme